jgi:hypothetical protein
MVGSSGAWFIIADKVATAIFSQGALPRMTGMMV